MISGIIVIAWILGVCMSAGFMIHRNVHPDTGIWMTIFWPLTIFGWLGWTLSRRIK